MTPTDLFMWGIYGAIFWLVFFFVCGILAILSEEGAFIALGALGIFWGIPFTVGIFWFGALILAIIQAI